MTLLLASATELARLIRRREVSPVEVVRAHIDRIEAVNPRINAVIRDRYARALDEARAAERRVLREPAAALPPLLGVPCTVKAAYALGGMPWDVGILARAGIVAHEDGPPVAALRAAGAIPVAQTNVPEGLMWFETYNKLHGRTGNPYDPGRCPGGSSGGEGAIVGAGASPFGLASDVAGSIRFPAFFNGIFGHKPSGGRVTTAGQYPPTKGERARFLCSGPVSRRAEDLLPLLQILEQPGWTDSRGRAHPLRPRRRLVGGDLRGLRVRVAEENGHVHVTREMRGAVRRAADALADRGAEVRPWEGPTLKHAASIATALMEEVDGWSFSQILGDGEPIDLARELLRAPLGRSAHILPSLGLVLIETLSPKVPGSARWLRQRQEEGRALRQALEDQLGDDGVLLHPPFPRTAMRHGEALLQFVGASYCALFNVMWTPVTQVPLGLDRRGLPLGVQVIGAEGRDALTIAVARCLEDACGGWVPPEL